MNFALLGDDLRVLPLAQSLATSGRHELLLAVGAPSLFSALRPIAPRLKLDADWGALLSGGESNSNAIDAVIVSGEDQALLENVRKLAETGKKLFVWPAVGQTSTFVFELALDQTDSGASLLPLLPLRSHPESCRLRAWMSSGRLGELLHIQLDRRISTNTGLLAANDLDRAFLDDVDLLRCFGGTFDQVTALRAGDAERGVSLATVTLGNSAETTTQAAWSVSPTTGPATWQLTVAGAKGNAVLSADPNTFDKTYDLKLELFEAGVVTERHQEPFHVGAALLNAIEQQAASTSVADSTALPLATWHDLTRAFELVDGVARSLRRRRTIDLHFEAPSERGIFKSHMTAVGCAILMYLPVGMVAYLLFAQVLNLGDGANKLLRALVFAPLFVFLFLQAFFFVTKSASRE